MVSTILKKENKEITQGSREIVDDIFYGMGNEKIFKDNISINKEDYYGDDLVFLDNQISTILKKIYNLDNKSISELYKIIKELKSRKDLENLYKKFLVKYVETLEEKYNTSINISSRIIKIVNKTKSEIEENFDLVILFLIKKIIEEYYLINLGKYKTEFIRKLEDLKINGVSVDYLYEELDESFNKQSIENGIKKLSSKILLETIDKLYDDSQFHLCWQNCKNATPNGCTKIYDLPKRKINEYDFIIDGYQIIEENGDISTFVVSKCSNYEEQYEKKLIIK